MHRAYELAMNGWGKVSPNPMVGAVIAKGNKVVAEGWHAICGGPHAEAVAIKKAGTKAKGADLYVTLEPCGHFGRTPPCVDAVIKAGIKRVFIGVLDPNPLMNGKSVAKLRKAGIHVETGFLQDELNRLNESFNKYITTGMPFVVAKSAQTLDGKIATLTGESKWITSEETREYSRALRFGFDAIVAGVNTVILDDPKLSVEGKNLKKVILDTHLRLSPKARLFQNTKPEDVLVFTASTARKNLKATIITAPLKNGKIDLRWVMKSLGQRAIAHVLIEGGGVVIGNALKNGLVDKMMIYVAPKIMGEGLDAIRGLGVFQLANVVTLKNTSVGHIGEDLFIEGYI
jgi:diaminohydroxyphosphoribosylaminopyrimidine deaminase / 5-amino-6-(5-phosphoribosylamino)uracil reductase